VTTVTPLAKKTSASGWGWLEFNGLLGREVAAFRWGLAETALPGVLPGCEDFLAVDHY